MRLSTIVSFLFLSVSAIFAQSTIAPTEALSPEEEKKLFQLPKGFEAQLVVSEPDIFKPMQMAWDLKGRLWVTTSTEYPFAAEGRAGKDTVVILSDFDENGKAKKVVRFADNLNIPIGILPLNDGHSCLVSSIEPAQAGKPAGCYIWKLTDTNKDGKADRYEKLYGPFGVRDTHGMVNSFTLMPDNWVYACHGFANESKVKGTDGHEVQMASGHIFRFRLDGSRIEVFSRGQVNPFGMTIDPYFNIYTSDCHSKPLTQVIRGAYYESFGKPHDGLGFGPNMMNHIHNSTGLCGPTWYEADHFPNEYRGHIFLCNVVTNRINLNKIEFKGSSPRAIEKPDFLVSKDEWFRPVDTKLGPDGALYIADFYNKIIGHYEVDLKHPGRDRTRGRIWRIVYTGKEATPPRLLGDLTEMKTPEVIKQLNSKNLTVRMLATHELIRRILDNQNLPDPSDEFSPEAQAHWDWVTQAPAWHGRKPKVEKHRHIDSFGLAHEINIQKTLYEYQTSKGLKPTAERFTSLDPKREPFAARAFVEYLARLAQKEDWQALLNLMPQIPAEDMALRHTARIALRDILATNQHWKDLSELKASELPIVAEVCLGLRSPEAADFLLKNLTKLPADIEQRRTYLEQATQYGNPLAVFQWLKENRDNNLDREISYLHGYYRALQRRGISLSETFSNEFSKEVAQSIIAANEGTIQRGLELAVATKQKNLLEPIESIVQKKTLSEPTRIAALNALMQLDGTRAITVAVTLINQPSEAISLREKLAGILVSSNRPESLEALTLILQNSAGRLQNSIALSMAGNPKTAELLLDLIGKGKASPRILLEKSVRDRLTQTKVPNLNERIAHLTKGLPTVNEQMNELLSKRKLNYEKFAATLNSDESKKKETLLTGAKVFKNACAICHQVAGEGAKIAPQLDGVGARGVERLLEDILDPSRNVDQALRTTVISTLDGKTLSGLLLRTEGKIYVLADAQGKEIRISQEDVGEKRESLLSPMPANFADTLKEEEFYPLIAYLLSLKNK